MQIDLPAEQRRAQPRDWKILADITAEAFAEDPVNLYAFGSPRAVKTAMRIMARDVYVGHGQCYLHGDKGATMWLAPGQAPNFGTRAMLNFALGMAVHGKSGALKRAMRLGELMAEHHPAQPHAYLFTIGTTNTARGKGIGKALMAPVLAACDRDGVPAYLENSNPANHGFYIAHGFERIAEFNVGDDGPVMAPMWRDPKPAT